MTARQTANHRWASVAEAAKYVGVTERSIRNAYYGGHIGKYPFGGAIRVDLNEIDAYMGKPA